MWHVSVKSRYGNVPWAVLEEIARYELRGVGDARWGEWLERGNQVLHLRRRLREQEMRIAGIVHIVDIRGTDEHQSRVARVRQFLPPAAAVLPFEVFP